MPTTTAASVLRSLTTIRRLGNGLALEARLLIEDLYNEIVAEVARVDPTGPAAERWRRERVAKLQEAVRHLTDEAYVDLHKRTREKLAAIGSHQSRYAAELLERTISARAAELGQRTLSGVGVNIRPGAIGKNMVKRIIDVDPIDGLTLGEWFEGQAANTSQRVMRQIRLGMVQGETTDDIVRRIRGRSAGISRGADGRALRTKAGGLVHRYSGGVMDTSTREATAIARTATNHIATRAQLSTYEQNADVLSGVRLVASLDTRTCPICMAHDGETWAVGSDDIQTPPLHINCRCALAPVVDWQGLGIDMPAPSTRASMGGQVSADLDYDAWLRAQPSSLQREVLGPGRMKLFSDGMHLRDMIRTDNTVMTIYDLERKAGFATAAPKIPTGADVRAQMMGATKDRDRLLRKITEEIDGIDKRIMPLLEEVKDWARATGNYTLADAPKWQEAMALQRREAQLYRRREAVRRAANKRVESILTAPGEPTQAKLEIRAIKPEWKAKAEEAVAHFRRLVPDGHIDGESFSLRRKKGRAYFSFKEKTAYMSDMNSVSVFVHELGHGLEKFSQRDVMAKAIAFRDSRTAGEAAVRLKTLYPGLGYSPHEVTKKDKFRHPYAGKIYQAGGVDHATEIISMGLEWLVKDPLSFAVEDPEYFDFMIRVLWH